MTKNNARDWSFSVSDHRCSLRAAGVLTQNGKILVQREVNGAEFALPGGHVQAGETLENSLIREFSEETGLQIRCEKMLWSEECFWEYNGIKTHSLCFYFLVRLCEGECLADGEPFFPQKDNANVLWGFLPTEALQNLTIYPEFIKQEIGHLDGPIRHFVTYA